MITFLPYTDFNAVARCLDDKRLGAQRYEAWSIIKWLRNPDEYPNFVRAGYCRMWNGYENLLIDYTNAMLVEWDARGKKNDLLKPYDPERKLDITKGIKRKGKNYFPPWLKSKVLQSYHRHALIAKDPKHYGKFGWSEDGSAYNGSYLWPIKTDKGNWILRWPKYTKLPPVPLIEGENATDGTSSTSRKGRKKVVKKVSNKNTIKQKSKPASSRKRKSLNTNEKVLTASGKLSRRKANNYPKAKRMKLRSGRHL